MSDGNTPDSGIADMQTGMSEEAAEAIGSLFLNDDDEEDSGNESTPTDSENETSKEVEASETDDKTDDQPDEDEAEEDETPVDQEAMELSPDLKVVLPDGSTTTAKELLDGQLRTADYTRKTQAVAEERRAIEESKSRVTQLEQQASEERAMMANLLQQMMPVEPDIGDLDTDPIGYMHAKEHYAKQMEQFQQIVQADQEAQHRQQSEMQEAHQQYSQQQQQAMVEAMPELLDPAKRADFTSKAKTALTTDYGFSDAELGNFSDHRLAPLIRDAMAFRDLQKKAPQAKEAVKGKPKMLKPAPRRSAQAKASKDVLQRIEQAEQSGNTKSVSDILGELIIG